MPVLDGWQATQEIQKVLDHRVPIVAVTANALTGDREKCLACGMDDYMTKPVRGSILLDVALQWINIARARQDAAEKGVIATAAGDDAGGGDASGDVSQLVMAWSSFAISDSVMSSQPSQDVRKRLLSVAPPSIRPMDLVGPATLSSAFVDATTRVRWDVFITMRYLH
jgi:hypothetical protein